MTMSSGPATTVRRGRPPTAAARIIAATARLIEEGEKFTDLPVERVLDEAQVSRSTFYVHFPDKSTLLLRVAETTLEQVTGLAASWSHNAYALGPDAAVSTMREIISFYRAHAALIRCIAEVAAYDERVRDLWRSRREALAARIADGLHDEQIQGRVAADVDVARTTSYVTLLADSAVLDHVEHGSARDDADVAAALGRMGWLAYYGRLDSERT